MEIKELTDQQALREMRAEYQRIETRLFIAERRLAAVLWCHGPMEIPKSSALIPSNVVINERSTGNSATLSVTMTTHRG